MSFPREKVREISALLEQKTLHLNECECCIAHSSTTGSMRDLIDKYIVRHFDEQQWDKTKTIYLADTMAGRLLQTATIIKSLVDAGYHVNISLVESDTSGKGIEPLEQFKLLLSKLTGPGSATLGAVCSNFDNYLSIIQASGPLQFRNVKNATEKETLHQSPKIPGDQERYLKISNTILDPAYRDFQGCIALNKLYKEEYKNAEAITGIPPTLMLFIDDITEFHSPLVKEIKREDKLDNPYFEQDALTALKRYAPQSAILATRKDYKNHQVSLLTYNNPAAEAIVLESVNTQELLTPETMSKLTTCKAIPALKPTAATPPPSPPEYKQETIPVSQPADTQQNLKPSWYQAFFGGTAGLGLGFGIGFAMIALTSMTMGVALAIFPIFFAALGAYSGYKLSKNTAPVLLPNPATPPPTSNSHQTQQTQSRGNSNTHYGPLYPAHNPARSLNEPQPAPMCQRR